ncbi:MAG: SAM-dependent methyltransferase [Burkholderiaceae bacterium]|jgi:16S rRNA (cytidine1402-2'-O)-methyltransferase
MKGTLYLVPSTLGEGALDAVVPMGVCKVAASLDYYIVENAKSARAFLKKVHGVVPLQKALQDIEMRELHVTTPALVWPELLAPLRNGRSAGLLSEAGCPAVADPGAGLVALAHAEEIRVRPLVGASSILLALMASGLNGQRFAFEGYLSTDAEERRKRLVALEARSRQEGQTQIVIETPYRNTVLLSALSQHLAAQTRVCVACDLSLDSELIMTRTARQWRAAEIDLHRRPAIFLFQA